MKLFYIEDYLYEIQEQLTSIVPDDLVSAIEAHTRTRFRRPTTIYVAQF